MNNIVWSVISNIIEICLKLKRVNYFMNDDVSMSRSVISPFLHLLYRLTLSIVQAYQQMHDLTTTNIPKSSLVTCSPTR